MQAQNDLLNLPDLALHQICSFLVCPIDLLHFGSTCSRLHRLSMSQSLWWHLAVNWCEGLWPLIEEIPSSKNPRVWLLELLRMYTSPPCATKLACSFGDGEKWKRVDSKKFRCLLGMLRVAYADRDKQNHPAVLYKRWIFDIGLYSRVEASIEFSSEETKLSQECICELASLGQAAERDLRARKQPYINPFYYVKKISVSKSNWNEELFPMSPLGTISPLLMSPAEAGYTAELSGISGLSMCLSLILEQHLKPLCQMHTFSLPEMAEMIKSACQSFAKNIALLLPQFRQRWGQRCLHLAVHSMASENTLTLESWQEDLNKLGVPLQWKKIICDLDDLLKNNEWWIDAVVDKIRFYWHCKLLDEVNKVLQVESSANKLVTRLNLTDSDLIGGDNRRQEMAAAAFISANGVLVTWQLIGRERY